jgi:hypothetical protein
MRSASKLVNQLSHQGHPWARGLVRDEIPILIQALRARLGVSESDLDLTPSGLRRLEGHLADYYRSTDGQGRPITDEDLLHLVREVTAYVGETLVRSDGARWVENSATLCFLSVEIEGPWEIIKETTFTSNSPAVFVLGGTVAWTWDLIASGKKPRLYEIHRGMQKRSMKERI